MTPRRVTDGGADNVGERFGRLPATEATRTVDGRPTHTEILDWWSERFGIPASTFEDHTFYERGAGKIWIVAGSAPDTIAIEGLGMTFMRTRQEHWKPTTNAVQRFGTAATKNVIAVDPGAARKFVAGEDQELDWDGDWGYLIVARDLAGKRVPLGVGLYVHGELRSRIPKGRQRELI